MELAIKTWPNKSQQEIAEQVGCTKQYVGQLKAEISKQVYLPTARTDSMGRTRPTSYATKSPQSATFSPQKRSAASTRPNTQPSPTDAPQGRLLPRARNYALAFT